VKQFSILAIIFIFIISFSSNILAQDSGSPAGSPKGSPAGSPKGSPEGSPKGSPKGSPAAAPIAAPMKSPLEAMMQGGGVKAVMEGTAEESNIKGVVNFFKGQNAVVVMAMLSGVNPGKHGIHIHEKGSCGDGGKAAGGHFNPQGTDHGFFPENGSEAAHLGDMGNIEIKDNGEGVLIIELPGVSLEGDQGILGHAVILHEKEDDFGQPTGNAGGRIGCGVIEEISAEVKE